jgi:hypothetical protein
VAGAAGADLEARPGSVLAALTDRVDEGGQRSGQRSVLDSRQPVAAGGEHGGHRHAGQDGVEPVQGVRSGLGAAVSHQDRAQSLPDRDHPLEIVPVQSRAGLDQPAAGEPVAQQVGRAQLLAVDLGLRAVHQVAQQFGGGWHGSSS